MSDCKPYVVREPAFPISQKNVEPCGPESNILTPQSHTVGI